VLASVWQLDCKHWGLDDLYSQLNLTDLGGLEQLDTSCRVILYEYPAGEHVRELPLVEICGHIIESKDNIFLKAALRNHPT